MTKAQIVQRLLEKKQITVEEAVTLLEKEFNSYPIYIKEPVINPWTTPVSVPWTVTY